MATFATSSPSLMPATPQDAPWDGLTSRDIHLIAMALSMSGGAGIRSTMPVFMLSLFHNLAPVDYPLFGPLSFLGEQEICAVLAALLVIEVVADSIPALDHALHLILTPAHPIMGAIVAMAPDYGGGWSTRALVGGAGALLALAVHAAKVALRAASSGCSCGTLNPVVSVCETAIGVCLVAVSTLHPALAAIVIIGFVCLGFAGLQNVKQALYPDRPCAKFSNGTDMKADARQALQARGRKGRNSNYHLAIMDEERALEVVPKTTNSLC